jgi:uncharacterized membrane protein YeaQ/YmgE (transglycosylase-associated protein family)
MVGAIVGGLLVNLLGGVGVTGFNIWSILVATLGAVVLLALYGSLRVIGGVVGEGEHRILMSAAQLFGP